jgi:hypothetical protein
LAKFIDFGKRHMDFLISEFVALRITTRPAAAYGAGYLPPIRGVPEEVKTFAMDQFEVKSHVGGLVKSFERKAA